MREQSIFSFIFYYIFISLYYIYIRHRLKSKAFTNSWKLSLVVLWFHGT